MMGSENGVKKQTWYDRAVVCTEACRGLEDPVAEVRAMVAAREADRWIPVEESLPALQVPVLVTCRCYREVLRCYLAPSGRWHLNASTSFAPEFILAWKALPKGYLGERRAGTPAPPDSGVVANL